MTETQRDAQFLQKTGKNWVQTVWETSLTSICIGDKDQRFQA